MATSDFVVKGNIVINGVTIESDGTALNLPPNTTVNNTVSQEVLVSGTNIKTINTQSILGSGNITIEGTGGGGSGTVTSVAAEGSTGISISGSPITTSGTLTITNTAPHIATNLDITGTGDTRTITSSTGTNATIPVATTTTAGLMALGDKIKLDGIATGAEVNAVDSVNGNTGEVTVQPTLISGTNIKTVNGTSLLGSGNITIEGNGGSGTVTSASVRQPVITSPTAGETGVDPAPTIVGGPYASLYSADARDFRLFEIDLASGDFSTPVVSEQVNADSFTVASNLAIDTNHKVRIKDVSVTGAESAFSDVVSFQTANITVNQPTLTVEGSPDDVPLEPTLTTSAFDTTPTGEDTHQATDWQILDSTDTVVFESLANQANLLSITVPANTLDVDETYTFRARHIGAIFGEGPFAIVVATTLNITVNAPTLTVAGAPTEVPETPTLTTGAFATTPAGEDTHSATDWIVRLTADDSVVFSSLNNTTDLLTIVVPAGLLEVSTEYKFRAQHVGTTFGASAVTEVVATTQEQFDIVPLLALSHATTPFVTIYNQEIDTFTKLADPASLPTGTGFGVAFSTDGTYLAVVHSSSPLITIYKRSGDTFTKLADPSTLPANTGRGVAFSTDGTYMAVAHSSTPFITIYKRSGDTFTKLANPSTLPTGTGNDVAFSTDDTYMAVTHNTTPFITIYKRAGDVFTKLANPASLPAGTGRGVAFSTDGTYMAVAHTSSPLITIYKRSGDTFTKLANPASLPPNTSRRVAFSTDGTYLAVVHSSTPFVTIYKRSGDTFTKLADPSTLPTGQGNGVAFSTDDTYMAVAHTTSPFITIYKRSGDTFTKLANPSTLPTGTGNDVAFSSTGFPQ